MLHSHMFVRFSNQTELVAILCTKPEIENVGITVYNVYMVAEPKRDGHTVGISLLACANTKIEVIQVRRF